MKKLIILLLILATIFSQDYLLVANKEEATVSMINLDSEKEVKRFNVGNGPHEIAVSPNNQIAVVSNYGTQSSGSTLTVISIISKSVMKTISLHHKRPHGIRFLDHGRRVLVTSESSQKILIVDIARGEVSKSINTEGSSHMVVFDENSYTAYTTAIPNGFVSIHDLNKNTLEKIHLKPGIEAIDLDQRRNNLWVGNNSQHNVQVIDLNKKEIIQTITAGLMPIRIRISRDGKYAYVATFLSGKLLVIDTEDYTVIKRIKLFDFTLDESDWVGKSQSQLQQYSQKISQNGARPIDILTSPDDKYVFVSIRGQEHVAKIRRRDWAIVSRIKTGLGPDGLGYVSGN